MGEHKPWLLQYLYPLQQLLLSIASGPQDHSQKVEPHTYYNAGKLSIREKNQKSQGRSLVNN